MKTNTNKFIKVIQTKKYKNINLYLYFSIENNNKMVEKIDLLCKIIGDKSNLYNSKTEMTKQKDMLYGINIGLSNKIHIGMTTLKIHYSFINPKYVDTTIDEYNNFIKETLYNSIIDENSLSEAKEIVKAEVLRKYDKPASLARKLFIENIAKENSEYKIFCYDKEYLSNIDSITVDELKQAYKFIINKAMLNVYICGDLDDESIFKLSSFRFVDRKEIYTKNIKLKKLKHKSASIKKDIGQSYLLTGYLTPYSKKHKDYFAWFVGNSVLSATPTSLLFTTIREKMSLCYSISISDNKSSGLTTVFTSIDGKNKKAVLDEIDNQIDNMISGNYDDEVLNSTKSLLVNSLLGLHDDLSGLVSYYFESFISEFNYSIEEYIDLINKVGKKDLSRVFKKYEKYYDFILLGK